MQEKWISLEQWEGKVKYCLRWSELEKQPRRQCSAQSGPCTFDLIPHDRFYLSPHPHQQGNYYFIGRCGEILRGGRGPPRKCYGYHRLGRGGDHPSSS